MCIYQFAGQSPRTTPRSNSELSSQRTVASGISLAESTPTRRQGTGEVSEHHLRDTMPVSVAGESCLHCAIAHFMLVNHH